MKRFASYIISILTLASFIFANFIFKAPPVDFPHHVTIQGTSTLHDWESEVTEVIGMGTAQVDGQEIQDISGLELKFKVNSIESGKEKMDKNTYQALQEEAYPYVTFQLTEIQSIVDNNISARGKLKIAGEEKTIMLKASGELKNDYVVVKGTYKLKMSDYKIEPPVVMFGALKTGDEVTVVYEVGVKVNQISN